MVITQKAIAHKMVDVKNKQLSSTSQQLAPMAEIIQVVDLKDEEVVMQYNGFLRSELSYC